MVVVVFFPGNEIILVELLLHISHVAVGLQSLFILDLAVQLIFVILNGSVLFISLNLIKLRIEKANLLCLLRVVLALGLGHGFYALFVHVHLLEQLLFVLLADARLVILGHLGALVHDLLVGLHCLVSILLFV